jgi:hypothetical protein
LETSGRSAYIARVTRLLAVSLSCALFLGAGRARADPDLPVRLVLGECPDLDEAEVRRITAAELRARPSTESGPDVLEVGVNCNGPRVVIRVQDPLSRKGVSRSFNLGLSDPRARSRLVAIAATELVLASWAELQIGRPLTVEPEGGMPTEAEKRAVRKFIDAQSVGDVRVDIRAEPVPVSVPPTAPAENGTPPIPYEPSQRRWYEVESPSDRMFRVMAIASTRKLFTRTGLLWGGGVRVGEERFRFFSWSADMLFENGTVGGNYSIFTATAGGSLFLWGRLGFVTGRIGAGLRAGLAEVGGVASTVAPWGWPLGTSSISIRIGPGVVLDLCGEGGYVVIPSERTGQADIKGGWFSGQVGFGFTPSSPPRPSRERAAAEAE